MKVKLPLQEMVRALRRGRVLGGDANRGGAVQGLGFRVQGSEFMVHGSWFMVQGSGCRVQGSGGEGFTSTTPTMLPGAIS